MQVFKCIVVEDEPLAADILQDYIAAIPFLQLLQVYPDAIAALHGLRENDAGVIFLDLHLPKLQGLDFLKTLVNPPQVIITTAYHEFAMQGYDFNVVDYLLKPIEFERFSQAVNKLDRRKLVQTNTIGEGIPADESMFVNTRNKKVRICYKDILFVESLKEYVRITTTQKSIITNMQLGEMEALLPSKLFMRIHRSIIVAKDKIDAYTAISVDIKQHTFPVGRSYKETLMNFLEQTTKS